MQWAEYRARRGSLNIGRRVEQAIGELSALYYNSKVSKGDQRESLEFMPHEDDVVIGFEELIE